MTYEALKNYFPWASEQFLRENSDAINPISPSLVESNPGDAALGAVQVQSATSQRVLVRITSVRKRLLDEDNLCEKYHVDLCRYAGIISGDEAGKAKIEVCQIKAKKGESERILIEVFNPVLTKSF